MKEKILSTKKNGMAVLVMTLLLYAAAIPTAIIGDSMQSTLGTVLTVIAVVWMGLGWIFWMGLKVLKPQEALVLTLFGNYIGTIKEQGTHEELMALNGRYREMFDRQAKNYIM